MYNIIKKFAPSVLFYFPFQSSTFASYLRIKILSSFFVYNNTFLIALQPKPLNYVQKKIVSLIKPSVGFTPSPTLKKQWDKKKINNFLVPLLTNLEIFKPLNKENEVERQRLRKKYCLPINSFIITHMGHLNKGRNLETLIPLQRDNTQVVIVGSSSTPKDAIGTNELKERLKESNIIIIEKFLKNIEELYQLSDAYIFPVVGENSSIGLPLSILEARACEIPVITTDYGSIKHFLNDDNGGIFFSKPERFATSVDKIKNTNRNYNKTKVFELNQLFYSIIHNKIDKS